MSTKAIRNVLRDMQCDYNPCLPGMCRKHEALAEVEAIERAAKVMDGWNRDGQRRLDPEMARAWSLMESISKDAPLSRGFSSPPAIEDPPMPVVHGLDGPVSGANYPSTGPDSIRMDEIEVAPDGTICPKGRKP